MPKDVGFWNPLARIVGEVSSSTGQTIASENSPTIHLTIVNYIGIYRQFRGFTLGALVA
jgi:hypothetical protein